MLSMVGLMSLKRSAFQEGGAGRVADLKGGSVLRQFETILKALPGRLQTALEPVGVAVEAYQPDAE